MKIRIIGPVGSGKTTLAHYLGRTMNLPVTSLDDINWKRQDSGDKHRTIAERYVLLDRLLQQDDWVVEGVQFRDGQSLFEAADQIYVIDMPYWQNIYYIVKRYIKSLISGGPKQYKQLRLFLEWQKAWRKHDCDEINKLLKLYDTKVTVIKNIRCLTNNKN